MQDAVLMKPTGWEALDVVLTKLLDANPEQIGPTVVEFSQAECDWLRRCHAVRYEDPAPELPEAA